MADFSKQWCDRYDKNGIKPDFDIIEIANDLEKGHYTPIICEGFGFTAIARDEEGEILLAIPSETYSEDNTIVWKKYEDVVYG